MGEPSKGAKQNEERPPSSLPLHNFEFPSQLNWGIQRQLRCMNLHPAADRCRSGSNRPRGGRVKSPLSGRSPIAPVETNQKKEMMTSNGAAGSSATTPTNGRCPIPPVERKKEKETIFQFGGGGGGGSGKSEIDAVRQKLKTDLRVEPDGTKATEEELNAAKPWNLRSRRGSRNNGGGGTGSGNAGASPLRRDREDSRPRMMEEEGLRGGEGSSGPERPKFSLTLTKEEIEADFLAMTGAKPPRRPKRRPKPVQKNVDNMFPGAWLREVTPDDYKVPDNGDQGK